LLAAQQLNLDLLISQRDSTSKILNFQQQLIDASIQLNAANRKIVSLQGSVISNIFGEGNSPNFTVSRASADKYYRNLAIQISNAGRTPFRGLRASITDIYSNVTFNRQFNRYESAGGNDSIVLFDHVKELEKHITIGDIPPGGGTVFYYVRLPRPFLIFGLSVAVTWDNGTMIFGFSGSFRESDDF
jgi:hypothetical protein